MTRHEALIKLLSIEDMPRSEIVAVTGWGIETTSAVISECRTQRLITRRPCGVGNEIMGAEVFGVTKKGRLSYASQKT